MVKDFLTSGEIFLVLAIVLYLGTTLIPSSSPERNLNFPNSSINPKKLPKKDITVNISEMSLKKRIAQMIIGYGTPANDEKLIELGIGGLHVGASANKTSLRNKIAKWQKKSEIPLFITSDYEGCVNGLKNIKEIKSFKNIETTREAGQFGRDNGEFLKDIGINLNFAPVLDLKDEIWKCRSLPGSYLQISLKAIHYIHGLQDHDVLGTVKHFPGKNLEVKDPHENIVETNIQKKDLIPFIKAFNNSNVSAVMIGHPISIGAINSNGKPASSSRKIIKWIRANFDGLIITDELRMGCIESYYNNESQKNLEVVKAGSDLLLNFAGSAGEIEGMIENIEEDVESGKISEDKINDSVRKILNFKGIKVVS